MRLSAALVRIAGIEADFFRDTDYVGYSIVLDKTESGFPKPIKGNWPGLPWDRVDTAMNWNNGKVFFFNGPQCVSFDVAQNNADAGYPKAIKAQWPGVPWDDLGAAVLWNNGKAYFFRGTEYVRFDVSDHKVDAGYPQSIRANWPGMPWDRVDAVVNWGNGKAYFFHDQEYVRYDLAADKVDPGYPQATIDHWPGVLPVTVRTTFDVKKHGFHFGNDFKITPGLFGGPGQPVFFGLCGGMCYAALARYDAHTTVETLGHPPQQTCPELELFWELIQRQAYTLYPLGLTKLMQFLLARDGSSGTETITGVHVSYDGIVTLSVKEWPPLRAALDRGKPVIVCLVRSTGTNDLNENHQVVAIGYRWAGGSHPTVFIYDPNHPEEEQTLTFSLDDKNSIQGIESDGKSMRGFFVNPLPTDH